MRNYDETINYITSIKKFGVSPGLENMERLMKLLGSPHKKLRFVHVAGTNGKGSTCAMLASVLKTAGYKTGLFVSPFVEDFRERIQINGEMIAKDELCKIVDEIEPIMRRMSDDGHAPTQFEVVTAIAMRYFADQGCDFVVLEVGLGGRFDATNIIDPPEIAIITSISFDHQAYLGDTIEKIAFEKCGIIKKGSDVCVYPKNTEEAMRVIRKTCDNKGIEPFIADIKDLEIKSCDISGSKTKYKGYDLYISLPGKHQIWNAITVVEAVEALRKRRIKIPDSAIENGINATGFGGRFEIVSKDPLMIIDGAHNIDGIETLCRALDDLCSGKRIVTVMGMMRDKDYERCIEKVAKKSGVLIATMPDSPRALPAEEMKKIAERYCKDVRKDDDPKSAAALAASLARRGDVIVACGSLYMIGDAKRAFKSATGYLRGE